MIEILTLENKKIILVGTSHISQNSVEEVENVIRANNPDSVAIELCKVRFRRIDGKNSDWENLDIESVLKKRQGMLMVVNFCLSSYQKKIGEFLGIKPGAEMAKAVEVAREKCSMITLADRDSIVTLRRILCNLKFWEKINGFCKLLVFYFKTADDKRTEDINESIIESFKNKETIAASLAQFSLVFPSVKKYLIDERDSYLAYKISKSPGESIVAVFGAAHLEGVKKHLINNDVTSEYIKEISQIPKKKKGYWISLGLLILFIILVAITFSVNPTIGALNIAYWLILTCTLGGLGAILAGGHPLTILVAIIGSPIGVVLPFISIGMISGIVEAKVRKPQFKDFESLNNVIFTFKLCWQNKILKIFTVFFLTSMGSAIGNILGIKNILEGFFVIFN